MFKVTQLAVVPKAPVLVSQAASWEGPGVCAPAASGLAQPCASPPPPPNPEAGVLPEPKSYRRFAKHHCWPGGRAAGKAGAGFAGVGSTELEFWVGRGAGPKQI